MSQRSCRHDAREWTFPPGVMGRSLPGGLSISAVCVLAILTLPAVGFAQSADGGDDKQDVGTTLADSIDLDTVLAKAAPETVAELKVLEAQVESVVEKVMDATVAVRVGNAQGSGVIVSADGYVMTAGHVSGTPGRRATIIFPDGRRVRGETLGRHARMDSGLIKITDENEEEWPFAAMGSSDELEDGTWVISLGHPGGYQRGRKPVVRLGRVLETSQSLIRTDCTLVGGDSGGPLYDMYGHVIGIHSRISRNLSQNYHVPVATYTETWDQLAASEEIGSQPPRLGIRGQDHEDGCLVTEVLDELPALAAGIQVGDVITHFGEREVVGISHLADMVQAHRRGRKVQITLIRDGEEQTVSLRIR
ncbi:MAG: S1C family serine protease [Pirellulales bacterium]|nr:S1C family serine protease [Pirellulales bacterium]